MAKAGFNWWYKLNRFLRGKAQEPLLHFCVMATVQMGCIILFQHKWVLVLPLVVAFAWEWGGSYYEKKRFSLTDFMFTFAGGYFAIFLLWDKIF